MMKLFDKLIDKKKTSYEHQQIYENEKLSLDSVEHRADKEQKVWSDYFARDAEQLDCEHVEHAADVKTKLGERLEIVCKLFLSEFVKADLLAVKYRRIYKSASLAIFLMAALAVIIVSGQFIFQDYVPEKAIFAEIILMVVILLIIFVGNFYGIHRKWIDYRFLAERLRFGLFVDFLTDEPSEGDKEGFHIDWLRKSWCLKYYKTHINKDILNTVLPDLPPGSFCFLKGFYKEFWLDSQINHHDNTTKVEHRMHKIISHASEFFYFLTLLVAYFHLTHFGHSYLGEMTTETWTFFAITFPVFGFTFSAIRGHFEFKKNFARSEAMSRCLTKCKEELKDADKSNRFFRLVKYTELVMHQENAGWHVSMDVHPPEIP